MLENGEDGAASKRRTSSQTVRPVKHISVTLALRVRVDNKFLIHLDVAHRSLTLCNTHEQRCVVGRMRSCSARCCQPVCQSALQDDRDILLIRLTTILLDRYITIAKTCGSTECKHVALCWAPRRHEQQSRQQRRSEQSSGTCCAKDSLYVRVLWEERRPICPVAGRGHER